MQTTTDKLTTLTDRKQEVQRELADIVASKTASPQNTALADLETILTTELNRIDQQIQQLNAYIDNVQDAQSEG